VRINLKSAHIKYSPNINRLTNVTWLQKIKPLLE